MRKNSVKNIRINSEVQKELSIIIHDEIKDPRSGLAMSILHSKKESTRLNDYQRGIVGVLASYTSTKRAPSEYDIARAFENYKDFRALYLGYKDYHTRPVKNMELLKQFK